MNETTRNSDDFAFEEQAQFHRLVDGRLSPDELRALILSFESDPDGWRRCALAFLEDQALRRDLGELVSKRLPQEFSWAESLPADCRDPRGMQPELAEKASPAGHASPVAPPVRWLHRSNSGWRLAAAMLASFVVGIGFEAWREEPAGEPVPSLVATGQPAAATGQPNVPATLVSRTPSDEEGIPLPVYDLSDDRAIRILSESPISRETHRTLRDLGYEVSQQRQYAPLRASDGRPVVVPIDEVQIIPIGVRAY